MHYFQFNIGSYRAATAHLSNDEDLAYRRLLDMYYDSENKIPLDTDWVARRLRLEPHVVRDVLNDMFVKHEDGWFHAKCDELIQQYHAMAEKNRKNGRLGGRKKNPVGNHLETHSEPIAKATINNKLETNNNKQKRESAVAPPPDVDEQVWKDWLTLRKAKKAPVTDTVVNNARKEAEKAGVTFQHFLMIWCARGSQGLQADWLKPAERGQSSAVSFAQQERELGWKRWEEMTGREHPDRLAHEGKQAHQFIDVQATDILEIGK